MQEVKNLPENWTFFAKMWKKSNSSEFVEFAFYNSASLVAFPFNQPLGRFSLASYYKSIVFIPNLLLIREAYCWPGKKITLFEGKIYSNANSRVFLTASDACFWLSLHLVRHGVFLREGTMVK